MAKASTPSVFISSTLADLKDYREKARARVPVAAAPKWEAMRGGSGQATATSQPVSVPNILWPGVSTLFGS